MIRRTRQAARRKFPAEEKIRIVLEGIWGEIAVSELCRREGIHPTIYYKWLKDFVEAGKVRKSPLSKARTLEDLGFPRSTYFRWQRRFRQQGDVGLIDRRPQPGTVWNRLTPQEEETILREALRQPELSSRELACWVTDYGGFRCRSRPSTDC